jgi:hypothetical protein
MIRTVAAVIIGCVVWFLMATVGNFLLRALLPGYATVEPSMAFSLSMLFARLVLGIVSSFVAGFVTAAVAQRKPAAVYAFAIVLVLLFLPVHFNLWAKFPVWYHITFLVSLAPLVLMGAAVRRGLG